MDELLVLFVLSHYLNCNKCIHNTLIDGIKISKSVIVIISKKNKGFGTSASTPLYTINLVIV